MKSMVELSIVILGMLMFLAGIVGIVLAFSVAEVTEEVPCFDRWGSKIINATCESSSNGILESLPAFVIAILMGFIMVYAFWPERVLT